jgi:transcriptional regulator with XRE-family HTH domain
MNDKPEPLSVTNLRRIWNLKKSEMQITQAQAAKELGWTQGAFSQYLNNLTNLNSTAVIKLANFLGVDPVEIDPDIEEYLPAMRRINVKCKASAPNISTQVPTYSDRSLSYFAVEMDTPIKGAPELPIGTLVVCTLPVKKPKLTSIVNHYLIQSKDVSALEYVSERNCPPKAKLTSKWLVHYFHIH